MEIVLWFFGIIIAFIAILEIIKKLADKKVAEEAKAEAEVHVADTSVEDTTSSAQVNTEYKIKFGFWEFIGLGFIVYIVYFLFFSGFNPNEKQEFEMSETQRNPYVSMVSDYSYTMRDKEAVAINISWGENRYDITMLRSEIKEGATLERLSPGAGGYIGEWKTRVVDASANIDDQYYAFNSREDGKSSVRVTINTLDKKHKEADLSVFMKIYNANTGEYKIFGKQHLKITGDNFDNFVNKPKKERG